MEYHHPIMSMLYGHGGRLEEEEEEVGTASRLTHLTVSSFLRHFNSYLPQTNPWRLFLLLSAVNYCSCGMLHTKRSPHGSLVTPWVNKTQHVGIGKPTVPGCAAPSISRESSIQSFSCKYLMNTYYQGYKWPEDCPKN